MTDRPKPPSRSEPTAHSSRQEIDAFLGRAKALAAAPHGAGRGRLIFALDATMSRQPTWDAACRLQAEMFDEASRIGRLDVQLVYYRGLSECRASKWVGDAERLGAMMTRIDCRGGNTQIGRVLTHAIAQTRQERVRAVVFVGDAMEEKVDHLCDRAAELALLNVPVFLFQEGRDPEAERAFREIARLTRGAWCPFDLSAAHELASLLRAVAAYSAGGHIALEQLSTRDSGAARLLLQQMTPR
jgi:hypothetical protein